MTDELSYHDLQAISAYLDQQLSASEQARLEARLQGESQLQNVLDELRDVRSLLRSQPLLRAPRNFTLTPEMAAQPGKAPAYPAFRLVAAFASIVLVILLVGDLFGQRMQPSAVPVQMEMRQAFEASPADSEEASTAAQTGGETVYLAPLAELEPAAPLAKQAVPESTPAAPAAFEAAAPAEAALATTATPPPLPEAADETTAAAELTELQAGAGESEADASSMQSFAAPQAEDQAQLAGQQNFGIDRRWWLAAEILAALLAVSAGLAWWILRRRT